jgi:hypothetical protein
VRAEVAHEALRHHADDRRGHQEGLDAHVDETRHGTGGVVGVQRAEHEVAGEGRLDGDLGGLPVADFAHHHHVGVLAQDGAQAGRKGEADLGVDLDLADATELILDGSSTVMMLRTGLLILARQA